MSATDSGPDIDGRGRTILLTCAALHTGIGITEYGFFSIKLKNGMRTDLHTHTTTNAPAGIIS
jgi:hypothetical protein